MKNLGCAAVCVLSLLWVGCTSHNDGKVSDRAVKVNVVEITNEDCSGGMYEYVGTIEESASTDIAFGTSGRVTSVRVREGQFVGQGQLIATVDNTTAKNSYNAAKATLDRAQDGYNRAKQVYEKGSLPEVKWVEVQTQLNQAQSMCDIAQKNLADCNLYAPVSGTVGARLVEVGANVTPVQPVVRLLDLSGLYVRMSVPEVDISKVSRGDKVEVVVNAADSAVVEGIVDEKGMVADPVSHSYLVRVKLRPTKEQKKDLMPGMVCRIRVPGVEVQTEKSYSMLVPNRAVQLDNDGERYVWVVGPRQEAERRYVKIGDLVADGVIISEGLKPGDKVIVDGTQKVSTGMKVTY